MSEQRPNQRAELTRAPAASDHGIISPRSPSTWPTAREIDRRRFVTGSAAAIALFAMGCREDTIAAPRRLMPGTMNRTNAPGSAFSYVRTITIDHTKVSGSQTNFTICVAGTVASLATVANGGRVTNANGYDIAFFSDSALSIPLSFERTLYTSATGKHAFWVKVPSLSSTADTVIYMVYGASTVTTDQQDRVNAWDSNYVEVHNFGNGTSFDGSDSTANGRGLTAVGASFGTDGIDGTVVTGTNATAERAGSNPPVTGYNMQATIESLFNPSTSGVNGVLAGISAAKNPTPILELSRAETGALRATFGAGAGGLMTSVDSVGTSVLNAANYGAAVFSGNANRSVYLNGAAGVQSTTFISDGDVPDSMIVGCRYGYNGTSRTNFFPGAIGQVRVSNVVRSAGWITTVDASTRGLTTFYTLGAETSRGGGTASPYVNAGTDGTDPGCDMALKNAQTAIAKSGDRRSATRALYAGAYEGAAYPANYNDITYPTVIGTTRNVTAGSASSLQAAINAAVPGDEIVIPIGAANKIIGHFTLPVKSGADQTPGGNNVVTIRAANINANIPYGKRVVGPSQSTRLGITATDTELLAHIQASGTLAAFDSNNVASHGYRFVGLYVTSDPSITGTTPVSRIFRLGDGNSTQNTDALTPKNNCIDRCLIRPGDPATQILHGVDFQVGNSYIIDSDISGMWEYQNGDSQAGTFYNTNGRLSFINTYFEASDEGVIQGGATNNVGQMVDLEYRWCVFGKPDSWNPSHSTYDGRARSIKLSAEIKHGKRSLWEGCYFVGSWVANQNGDALNIKNEYEEVGGTSHTSDIIVRYCDVEKVGSAFRVMGGTYAPEQYAVRNVVFAHNEATREIGTSLWDPQSAEGYWMQTSTVVGIRAVHNTALPTRLIDYLIQGGSVDSDGKTDGLVHRDNIYGPVTFDAFRAAGVQNGVPSLNAEAPGALVNNNVLVGQNASSYTGSSGVSGNFFPATLAAVGFTDLAGGNYSLQH